MVFETCKSFYTFLHDILKYFNNFTNIVSGPVVHMLISLVIFIPKYGSYCLIVDKVSKNFENFLCISCNLTDFMSILLSCVTLSSVAP